MIHKLYALNILDFAYFPVVISFAFCAEIIDVEHFQMIFKTEISIINAMRLNAETIDIEHFMMMLKTENSIIHGMRRHINMRAEATSERR